MEREYLDVKYINTDTVNKTLDVRAQFNKEVITNASQYTVSIIRAEVPVAGMPVMVIQNVTVQCGDKVSSLDGEYLYARSFIEKLNSCITDFGKFEVVGSSLKFTSTTQTVNSITFNNIMYPRLFEHLGLIIEGLTITKPTTEYTFTQLKSTIDRFFFYKTIAVTTSLPVNQEWTINSGNFIETSYLTDIMIAAPSDITHVNDVVYMVPTSEFRRINLVSSSPITEMSFGVNVYYKNGIIKPLTVLPGEFFNLKLMFEKRISN